MVTLCPSIVLWHTEWHFCQRPLLMAFALQNFLKLHWCDGGPAWLCIHSNHAHGPSNAWSRSSYSQQRGDVSECQCDVSSSGVAAGNILPSTATAKLAYICICRGRITPQSDVTIRVVWQHWSWFCMILNSRCSDPFSPTKCHFYIFQRK